MGLALANLAKQPIRAAYPGENATTTIGGLEDSRVTDVYSGWAESRAVLGRGRAGVVQALEEIAQALPTG
jgi:hypothetical protein